MLRASFYKNHDCWALIRAGRLGRDTCAGRIGKNVYNMSSRKRKARSSESTQGTQDATNDVFHAINATSGYPGSSSLSSALLIQAYEATVVCGPRAQVSSSQLEVPERRNPRLGHGVGKALIRFGGEKTAETATSERDVWVDRYALV